MRNTLFAVVALLAVALISLLLRPPAGNGSRTAQRSVTMNIDQFAPGRHWGRPAFVPDWGRGELIDRAASAEFVADWLPALDTCPQQSKGDASTPRSVPAMDVWPVDYWQAVAPDRLPGNHTSGPTPALFAAQGESEPYAIAVRLEDRGGEVKIRIEPPADGSIPFRRTDIGLRVMLPLKARLEPRGPSDVRLRPMVLLAPAADTWAVPPACTTVFVADFHVPARAEPGRYATRLVVEVDGTTAAVLPLTIDVLPFHLRVNDFHAGAFGTTYDIWEGGFTGYYPEMTEMDSRYGFNLAGGFFNKGAELPFRHDPAGRLRIDRDDARFAAFDATMQRLRDFGMGDVLFWNWGASGKVRQFNDVLAAAGVEGPIDTPAGKLGFAAMLRAIKDVEQERNWPEIVINPFDEALKDQDATREVIEAMPLVKRLSPASRIYMTEWRPGYTRHYQSAGQHLAGQGRPREAEYEALMDAGEPPRLNFHVIGANTLDDDGRRLQDALGGEYWHYTGAWRVAPEARFAFGFRPWIQRSEAVLMWANYKGRLDGSGWTLHYVLPRDPQGRRKRNTRGPVVPSAWALAVREGIDDRKYIETLRYHAWRLGSTSDLEFLETLMARARRLLVNHRELGGIDNVEGRIANGRGLQQLRVELRDRILELLAREEPPFSAVRAP